VYAHVRGFARHERARAWLDERLNGTARLGMPWPSLLAFLRLVTNPRVFERPASPRAAWQQVADWLDCEAVWVPAPSDPDAHLAALAIEHGLALASTDGDFARFPVLRFENPLAGLREKRSGTRSENG
jgi:uncharacterized protein